VAPQEASALFVFAANTDPALDADFGRWLETEQLPRVAALPGVICARAFRTPGNAPGSSSHRFVATSHTQAPAVWESQAWSATWERQPMVQSATDTLGLKLRRYVRTS
jgi:hypothetical protein